MSEKYVPGQADEIIRALCNEHRNSDIRADNRELHQRLNDAFAARDEQIAQLKRELEEAREEKEEAEYAMGHWQIIAQDAEARVKELERKCPHCGGSGTEYSDVCHCGASMEGHGVYDNHSATEMTRPCQTCTKSLESRLAALLSAAEPFVEHGLDIENFVDTISLTELRTLAEAVRKAREEKNGK